MTVPTPPSKLRRALRKRLPEPREDSGLTTLEWLLIVAAVAGLAALAVVLVQNVVSDTSEQIAGSSARKTAAQIAATEIMADAVRAASAQPDSADTLSEWFEYYSGRCNRLKITYGDADITVNADFATSAGQATNVSLAAGEVKTGDVTAANAAVTVAADKALAHCRVT